VLPGQTPILPVRFDSEARASELAGRLLEQGVAVQTTAAPYVPAGTSRIRLIASAAHTAADLDRALEALSATAPTT
jgi:glycine C-acetyltransferase